MELNDVHTSHEHASSSMKVVLLVFGLALVVVLGYLVWQQNGSSDTTDNGTVLKTKTVTTTTTADPTANWKTYTNTNLKFSFKYPATFTVTDALQTTGNGTTGDQKLTLTDTTTTGHPTLMVWVNPPGFDSAPTNLLYTFSLGASNKLSTASTAKQTIDPAAPNADSTHYIAGTNLAGQLLNGKTFVIRYSYLTGNDTLLTTFDQLIKTFEIDK